MAEESGPVSRAGTARALVLVGSALQLALAGFVAFVLLVFGPVLAEHGVHGPVLVGVAVFGMITLAGIVLANLVALRAAATRAIAVGGCGTLLITAVIAVGALLLIVV